MSVEHGHLHGQRIAVIGAGAMGSALCRGLVESRAAKAADVIASDPHETHLFDLYTRLAIQITPNNREAAEGAEILILAVKPFTMQAVLAEIAPVTSWRTLVISIAAGIRIDMLESALREHVPVIRAMPNTAAQVREGACAYCRGTHAAQKHAEIAAEVFRSFGTAVEVEERMMDAVTAVSGSGPAYVYLMIEAMVDGGVKAGLPRDLAHQLATQTVLGAAKMVMETGMHPAQLKDKVATPSGTTITALAALEQSGFRAALIDAVERAAIRSKELGSG